ncbi:MFS transporter [Microbacterium sp. CFH 31415]|uniref:MFS transporter n=1 Tax=Microbacterium sp. CFH 31415 TaxID=2921732 RepID=UPI001F144B8B|nr:MFS transporter [Microbacterium sp. CFH 31415]MCH6230014.1 MFS transporter [Microbacterium sp. CFH 31415]
MLAGSRPRVALALLAVAQVVAWGALYYAVLVAAPAIATETGWDEQSIFLAVTGGLMVSAACGVVVGRWLDARPRVVMVVGAVASGGALLCAAAAQDVLVFAAAWLLVGAAQSAVLYQAVFTVITHRYRGARHGPLTIVTLAGGLASTIFAPLTAALVDVFGWRITFAILAGLITLVVVPIYTIAIEDGWEPIVETRSAEDSTGVLSSARFWLLGLSFATMSFALYAVTLSAVPAYLEKGLDLQAAAWVLGVIGAGSVLGRLVYLALPHAAAPWVATVAVGLAGAVALAGFGAAQGTVGIFLAAVITGALRGVHTLVQASAISDRWGHAQYGRLNGALALPVIALTALAPGAASAIAGAMGSYQALAFAMAALCGVGGLLAVRR